MPDCQFCLEKIDAGTMCRSCLLWSGQIDENLIGRPIIINGWHYRIGKKPNSSTFVIRFRDRKPKEDDLKTSTLETIGKIPDFWRPFLADTADLICFLR